MNTLKKILIMSMFMIIAIAGCSPAIDNLDASTATNTPDLKPTNTQLPTSGPIVIKTVAPTNTPDPSRDLSAPSTIIVGHWRSPIGSPGGPLHFYFGNFDENGNARCFYNELFERELRPSTCHIFREEENTLWITITTEDESHLYNFPFTPANDGQTMLFDDDNLFGYVDSSTEPESTN